MVRFVDNAEAFVHPASRFVFDLYGGDKSILASIVGWSLIMREFASSLPTTEQCGGYSFCSGVTTIWMGQPSSAPWVRTPLPRFAPNVILRHPKSQCFRDSRDAKHDSIWVRDAKCNAAGAMHRVAWALQTAKGTSPKCEKSWENQGFLAERTGTELLSVFPMFLKSSKGTRESYDEPGRVIGLDYPSKT